MSDESICGYCQLPIDRGDVVRYFGTFVAHGSERCAQLLRARLADEQAKRVAAEEIILNGGNLLYKYKEHIADLERRVDEWHVKHEALEVRMSQMTPNSAYNALAAERSELKDKVADLERRLSTVPEDFGPLIDELISAAKRDARDPVDNDRADHARAALAEKIAALQFRLDRIAEIAKRAIAVNTIPGSGLHYMAICEIQDAIVERRVRICGAPLSSSRSKNCLLPEGHSGSHQFSTSPE